jgi:phosphoglycerate dehydrogenase-like enzyme
VTLYDPYVDAAEAAALGAALLPLDELMSTSDIVSLHVPTSRRHTGCSIVGGCR